ncbi:MAG: spore coat U domain-containing protein [Candidatus Binataceae bacterium]
MKREVKREVKRVVKRVSFYNLAAAAVVLIAMAGQAGADNTGTVGVSATVANACVVTNSPSMSFGTFNPVDGANVNQTGTISIACTKGAVAKVALDPGANGGKGGSGSRAMSDGSGDFLGYEIYSNSGMSTVWGIGANAVTESAAPSTSAVNYTAYGQIPTAGSNQNVPAASYSDTVNLSISF